MSTIPLDVEMLAPAPGVYSTGDEPDAKSASNVLRNDLTPNDTQ
jgi:hypothetical protein